MMSDAALPPCTSRWIRGSQGPRLLLECCRPSVGGCPPARQPLQAVCLMLCNHLAERHQLTLPPGPHSLLHIVWHPHCSSPCLTADWAQRLTERAGTLAGLSHVGDARVLACAWKHPRGRSQLAASVWELRRGRTTPARSGYVILGFCTRWLDNRTVHCARWTFMCLLVASYDSGSLWHVSRIVASCMSPLYMTVALPIHLPPALSKVQVC